MKHLKWAWRDLRNSPRFGLFFILNASLALSGVLSIQTVDRALSERVAAQSSQILGADLTLSARRSINADELETLRRLLPETYREQRSWEFFTMLRFGERSQLTFVKAVDDEYPFYGRIEVGDGRTASTGELRGNGVSLPGIWVSPEFLIQNEVKVGDKVFVGAKEFQIKESIFYDTTQGVRFATMAQRIYLHRSEMEETGLFSKGTTFTETFFFSWSNRDKSADDVAAAFFKQNQDPTLRLTTLNGAKRDFARPLQYLTDYLGLVSVAALSLGFVGMSYLSRSFLLNRRNTIALWKCLGMSSGSILLVFLIEFLVLGFASALTAAGLGAILTEGLKTTLDQLTPTRLSLELDVSGVLILLFIVGISILASAVPPILQIARAKVRQVLNAEFLSQPDRKQLWMALPMLLVLLFISLWFSNSYRVGFGFLAALVGVLLIFSLLAWLVFRWLLPRNPMSWQWAQVNRYLSRNWLIVSVHLIALGLGALLLGIFPHLKKGVEERFAKPDESQIPSLFLFDIQDEQLAAVQALISGKGHKLTQLSPLVRSRIVSINGQGYERPLNADEGLTREEEEEARFRNRGVNLSYRADLARGDEIVAGEPFSGTYSGEGLFEISVEDRYADRMGIRLGDRIRFDVQGVEFEGQVRQLRSVNWSQFQPNFFILLQPGVVDEAPKTWLAGVPGLDAEMKKELIKDFAANFSNVSVVDVNETVKRVMQTSDQMLESVNLMFVLLFIVGAMVLFTVLVNQGERRVWDLNLMRILGANRADIRGILMREFLLTGLFSATVAAGLSVFIAQFVGAQFFEGMSAFSLSGFFATVLTVTVLSLVLGFLVGRKIYSRSIQAVLRGDGT